MKELIFMIDVKRVELTPGELRFSEKKDVAAEIETFVSLSMLGKIPVEVIHLKRGSVEIVPESVYGMTSIRFVGTAPAMLVEHNDQGYAEMIFVGPGAVEMIFNSEKLRAHGRNNGAHGRKKIYIIE